MIGTIGYSGYHDVGGLDWSDFMDEFGNPLQINLSSWSEWSSQPIIFNVNGQHDFNRGDGGNLLKNLGVYSSSEQHQLSTGWDSVISGNFTPTLQDNSLSDGESQTYTVQRGRYRKHGDMVTFWISITVNSLGTLTTTDTARIAGLPFASKTIADGGIEAAVHVGYATSLAITANSNVSGYIPGGDTVIQMYEWNAATGISALTIGEVSAGGQLILSGQYLSV